MSRSSYPSAHGHTPSYRSAASTVYPSALGSDTGSFSSGLSSRSTLSTDLDRDMARHVNSSLSTSTRYVLGRLSTRPPTLAPLRPRTRPRSTPAPALALPMGACHTGKATTTRLTGALGLATQGFLTPAMPTQHHRSTVTDPTRTPSPTSHTTFKPWNNVHWNMNNVVRAEEKNQ